jgi:DNA invertase Pin-like site-specific DNA recombinase
MARKGDVKSKADGREVVGYIRVVKDDQAREGASLAAQEERIRARCIADGRRLASIVREAGKSAKTLERPGLTRILAAVETGTIGAVVVLKLDRLTRSVKDLADLLELFAKHGVVLVSVTESIDTSTAAGALLVNILGSVAQWERKTTAERTVIALAHLRKTGKVYGRIPYGYFRSGDFLARDMRQQRVLTTMRGMRTAGYTFQASADKFNHLEVKPPRGKAWYPSSVRNVLESRMAHEA